MADQIPIDGNSVGAGELGLHRGRFHERFSLEGVIEHGWIGEVDHLPFEDVDSFGTVVLIEDDSHVPIIVSQLRNSKLGQGFLYPRSSSFVRMSPSVTTVVNSWSDSLKPSEKSRRTETGVKRSMQRLRH